MGEHAQSSETSLAINPCWHRLGCSRDCVGVMSGETMADVDYIFVLIKLKNGRLIPVPFPRTDAGTPLVDALLLTKEAQLQFYGGAEALANSRLESQRRVESVADPYAVTEPSQSA